MAIGAFGDVPRTRKPRRQFGDAVAVAHPYRIALAYLPDAVEQRGGFGHARPRRGRIRGDGRLRPCRRAAPPSPARRSRCRAPARRPRKSPSAPAARPFRCTRRRTAGEDHRLGRHLAEGRFGLLERHDLAIDPLLAHAPRDQLRHLRAEIDDENFVVSRHSGFCPTLPSPASGGGSGRWSCRDFAIKVMSCAAGG